MATIPASARGFGVAAVGAKLKEMGKRWSLGVASFTAFVVVWHLATVVFDISGILLPQPSAVLREFVDVWEKDLLWPAALQSARPLFAGLALAIAIGIVLGLVIGASSWLDLITSPYLWGLFATPRIAMAPLFVLWFGFGFTSKMWLVFLSAVLPMTISAKEGVQTVDETLIRAAQSFGASKRDLFINVIIPYTLPFIATGVRNAIARGFVGLLIIELTVGSGGIGTEVMRSMRQFNSARMFAFIAVLIFIAMVLISLSRKLEARMSRWREEVYV
jgi:ABC-type nitrate/sulfonate/bicarbonate transport system permease component